MNFDKSAGAVVFRRGKEGILFLLLNYPEGHWDFTKGGIEKGEKEKETVKREIKEETGLENIEFVDGFEELIRYFFKREGSLVLKTVKFFLIEAKEGDIKLSFEHNDFKWLPFKEAMEKTTFKNSKKVLEKANDFLKKNG